MGQDSTSLSPDFLRQFIHFLLPSLTPYEAVVYLYLVGQTHLQGQTSVRIGLRTMIKGRGTGTRSADPSSGNMRHFRDRLESLEKKGCIMIGDSTKSGTLYFIRLPVEIPIAQERMKAEEPISEPRNSYTDPDLRRELFARDGWTCRYCGEVVTADTATLDHILPTASGGADDADNLATACHPCNSIKSGKTEADAAALILASIRDRRRRSARQT